MKPLTMTEEEYNERNLVAVSDEIAQLYETISSFYDSCLEG